MSHRNNILRHSYLLLVYAFFYIPIVTLAIYSFNNTSFSLVWHGFTLQWYTELFHDYNLWVATYHSLFLGILSAAIATCIGSLAALSLYKYNFLGRQFLNGLVFILIVIPDIVLGIALLLLFNLFHLSLGFFSLLLAHISLCMPFVIITVYSRLKTLDKNLYEAAKDLGAKESTIFYHILLPLLTPALIASALLSFTLSFDDVIVSYFVSGPGFEILPLKIFSMARLGVKPELNALCTLIVLLTFLLVALSQLSLRRKP